LCEGSYRIFQGCDGSGKRLHRHVAEQAYQVREIMHAQGIRARQIKLLTISLYMAKETQIQALQKSKVFLFNCKDFSGNAALLGRLFAGGKCHPYIDKIAVIFP
jgi:hypothetical protein